MLFEFCTVATCGTCNTNIPTGKKLSTSVGMFAPHGTTVYNEDHRGKTSSVTKN